MLLTWCLIWQYPWAMCDYHVWCYCPSNIQECPYLAPWSLQVRKSSLQNLFFSLISNYFAPSSLHQIMEIFCPTDFSGSVKTSQLFFAVTRLMSRTGKWRQSRLLSTGRRICSTTRYLLRATTILKSHFCTWPGNLQGRVNTANFYFLH